MPRINKQRPQQEQQAPVKTEASSSTASTSNGEAIHVRLGLKLNVYGRGKTGKTRLVCSFPKPLLLIGTEDGTKSICTVKKPKKLLADGNELLALYIGNRYLGIDFLRLRQSTDLDTAIRLIVEDRYNTGALDHAGGLQDLIIKEVLGLAEIPVERTWGLATKEMWGIIGQQTNERLRQLLDLADRFGINVPIIAHERNFKEDSPSDIIQPHIGAALTPGSKRWLDGAVDYICQAYIAEQRAVTQVDVGGGQMQEVSQPTGKCEYRLRIGPHAVYNSGFRTVGDSLPDYIVNPSYKKIVAIIEGRTV